MTTYKRPDLPYAAAALKNSERFKIRTETKQPISAETLDSEINYCIDSLNNMKTLVDNATAGVLPGANNPANINKVATTNGDAQNPVISWKKVDANILGTSAVQSTHIATYAVTNTKIANNAVTSAKIANDTVGKYEINDTVFQRFFSQTGFGRAVLTTYVSWTSEFFNPGNTLSMGIYISMLRDAYPDIDHENWKPVFALPVNSTTTIVNPANHFQLWPLAQGAIYNGTIVFWVKYK
ncbi:MULTISPECIES: hypothetical protein [Cysteiniphilum]|uniref:hypothetical protein n=1 Tax=Cysteiniphilum TaxID=2056696 RepID=UPI00177C2DC0|nr:MULTISPECIES: hypothetical protein [Cysteiniphilum]